MMEREFVMMPEFDRQWRKLGLNDDDLRELQDVIKNNPKLGSVVKGTGGLRKIRFAFEGAGKRGSARVLYVDLVIAETVILLGAYAKNMKEDLTEEEKNRLKALVKQLKNQFGNEGN
jgi:hypothetical protein